MSRSSRVLVLQPPSPPGMNVYRDYAGGYGTASPSDRAHYGHDRVPVVPCISLLYVAALLELDGHRVGFLDGQAERLSAEGCCDRAAAFGPDVVVSVISLPSLWLDLALLRELKRAQPKCTVVAIGTTCRGLPHEVLSQGGVDVAVIGDAEVVLPSLLRALPGSEQLDGVAGIAFSRDGAVIQTPSAPLLDSLDTFPVPAYHLAAASRYWHHHFGPEVRCAHVITSRGCPERCGFYCPYPFGFGPRTLFRPVEAVVEELTLLRRHYDVGGVVFRDMNFTASRPRTAQLCEEMLRRNLRLRWLCEVRLNQVNPELLSLMRAAGCERIHYGLETGDPKLLSEIGKPGVDLETATRAVAQAKAAGLNVQLHLMLGLPGETWDTVRQTQRTLRRLRPDSVQIVLPTPYPGTRFREEALADGRVRCPRDWPRYTGSDAIMDGDYMSVEEFVRARDWLNTSWRDPVSKQLLRRAARSLLHHIGRRTCSN